MRARCAEPVSEPGPSFVRISAVLAVAFLPASLAWPAWAGASFYLMAVVGLVALVRDTGGARAQLAAMRWSLTAALLIFALNLASVLALGTGLRELSWTTLALMPLVCAMAAGARLRPVHLYAGAATGGLCALAVCIADFALTGAVRPTGQVNAIVFAQVALFCSLAAIAGALSHESARLRALCAAGALAGVVAAFASGSRGPLAGLPVLAIVVWLSRASHRPLTAAQRRVAAAGVAAVIIAAALLLPRLTLWERLQQIDDEVAAYEAGDVGEKSVAQRLAMWRASLRLTGEHPWAGIGTHRFKAALQRLQASGDYPRDAIAYSHPHNVVLSVMVQYGLAGIAVFAGALALVWRDLGRRGQPVARFGRAGIVMWILFGLTSDMLAHQNTLRATAVGLALALALWPLADADSTV